MDRFAYRTALFISTAFVATLCACATPTATSSGAASGEPDCTPKAAANANAVRSMDALMTSRVAPEPAAERAAFDAVAASRSEDCVGEPGSEEVDEVLEVDEPEAEEQESTK